MPGTCVIGLQWGDEAKGKLVDLLTPNFDLVVRYQGGANAGHTVVIGDKTFKLHHIPSGILNPQVKNIIAPGVVLNPGTILQEIDSLLADGVDPSENMIISDRVHVVCPWHIEEDKALNAMLVGGESIGTTLRGIGPCYRDKVGRTFAIRLGDMFRDDFAEKVRGIVTAKKRILSGIRGDDAEGDVELDADAIISEFNGYAERLKPYVADTNHLLHDAVADGKKLLFEGAQGVLLDIDHGTFPFVTSSNSSGVGITGGSGVPPKWINKVIGVIKSYSTRVGGGPFPTELDNEVGAKIRDLGNEYGTTTGRPRRCGWFDAVAVRYSARLSGVDALSLMMLDVMSHLDEIKICTAYRMDGVETNLFPSNADDLRRAEPVYETLPGWNHDVTAARSIEEIPELAMSFANRVGEIVGVPVAMVSVGPDRAQSIFVDGNAQQMAGVGG